MGVCTKLHLNQFSNPRKRPQGSLGLCLVTAVAHPTSRGLLACLPDALLCTDSPRDRLSDSSDPKGSLLYVFSSLFFFKGKGEFFKPKPFLVVFVVLVVFKMFLFLKGREFIENYFRDCNPFCSI